MSTHKATKMTSNPITKMFGGTCCFLKEHVDKHNTDCKEKVHEAYQPGTFEDFAQAAFTFGRNDKIPLECEYFYTDKGIEDKVLPIYW